MSKRLKPYELLQGHRFSGISVRETVAMLEHYGYREINDGHGKHMVFAHKEIHDLPTLRIPKGGGEIKRIYVREACVACMRVKQHNAELRNAVPLKEVPFWVMNSLPPEDISRNSDHSVYFTTLRPDRVGEEHAQRMRYRLCYQKNQITMTNEELPDSVMRIKITPGNRHRSEPLARQIEDFDLQLRTLRANHREQFDGLHYALLTEFGLQTHEATDQNDRTVLRAKHPAFGAMGFEIPVGLQYTDEALTKLRAANDACADLFFEQELFKEEMAAQGWQYVEESKPNGHAGRAAFVKDGRDVKVDLHGSLALFDVRDVRERMEASEKSAATPRPTIRVSAADRAASQAREELAVRLKRHVRFTHIAEVEQALDCVEADYTSRTGSRGEVILEIIAPYLKRARPQIFGRDASAPITFTSRYDHGIHDSNQPQLQVMLEEMLRKYYRSHGQISGEQAANSR